MKYLFICDGGINRSPTAASISKELARKYGIPNYEADYSGIDSIRYNPQVLSRFDRIFVMSGQLEKEVTALVSKQSVVNLNVPDNSEKENNIKKALEPHFHSLNKSKIKLDNSNH